MGEAALYMIQGREKLRQRERRKTFVLQQCSYCGRKQETLMIETHWTICKCSGEDYSQRDGKKINTQVIRI